MKVLHVSGSKSWGGNEQQLVDSIYDLNKIGVSTIIFCYTNSPLEKYCFNNNFNYIGVPRKKSYSLSLLKLLRNAVREHEIDIIHVHTSNAVTTCVLADIIYKFKIPIVFSKKGLGKPKKGLSAFKYNYKNLDSIICVSHAVKESFKKTIKQKNHHKLEVVYDGIRLERVVNTSNLDIRKEYNIASDVFIVGNIANHTRAKDLKTYVKTINHLVNVLGFKKVMFLQIGESSKYSDEFMPLVEEYKLNDFICFLGFSKTAMDMLSQFDVYFMSSEREGLPITIYEAFYKKIPVVSTKAGGIPEAIVHGENGFLSEVGDYKDLAINIQKLLLDNSKKEMFAERSYTILLDRFTSVQLAENTYKVYKRVLNKSTTSSLIITTYNWPEALDLVLCSVKNQKKIPNEVIIADDGSSEETKNVIDFHKNNFPVPLIHVWHKDDGFRKTMILNLAISKSNFDYIIQLDGDCIMHKNFISDHVCSVERNTYLYGSRVNIQKTYLENLYQIKKIHFSLFSKGIKKRLRTIHLPFLGTMLYSKKDTLSKKVRGCNLSYWKSDFVEINGYNEDMTGWGREDSEMVARLINKGVQSKRLKFKAIIYHIWHKESSKDKLIINDDIQENVIKNKSVWCDHGIDKYLN